MDSFRALLVAATTGERGALARFSERSGFSVQQVLRWRDGKTRPSDDSLRQLAPFLNVSAQELLQMCGYLPGEATPTAERHPVLEYVNRSWDSLEEWRQQAIAALVPGAPTPVLPARNVVKGRQDATAKRLKRALNTRPRKSEHDADGPLVGGYRRLGRPLITGRTKVAA